MRFRTLIPSVLFTLVATISPHAMAQTGSAEIHTDVPFSFLVGKKLLPKGNYTVYQNSNDVTYLQLAQGDDRKHITTLFILTRLARHPLMSKAKASMVFDTYGGQQFLSEVWLPDSEGFQVSTTTQNHKHEFVEGKE